ALSGRTMSAAAPRQSSPTSRRGKCCRRRVANGAAWRRLCDAHVRCGAARAGGVASRSHRRRSKPGSRRRLDWIRFVVDQCAEHLFETEVFDSQLWMRGAEFAVQRGTEGLCRYNHTAPVELAVEFAWH